MSTNKSANVKTKTVTVGGKDLQIEVAGNQVKVKDGNVDRYFTVEEKTGNNASQEFNKAAKTRANNKPATVTTNAAVAAATAAVSPTSGNSVTPPVVPLSASVTPSVTTSTEGATGQSGGRRRRTRRTRRRR